MQTFLPYPNFAKSAQCLDNKRLGKQRVECKQIYLALTLENYGWKNHPAVRMWKYHRKYLCHYGFRCCVVWKHRGFKDSLEVAFISWLKHLDKNTDETDNDPEWLGDGRFHASHRSNLLRKDPVHYGQFGWSEPNDLPYFWPTKHEHKIETFCQETAELFK